MRRRRSLLAVPALLLVPALVACSDDDGSRASGRSAPTTTTSLVFTGDPGSAFCTYLRQLQLQDALAQPARSAADIEAGFSTLLGALTQAAQYAPEELKTDTALLLAGVSALDDALRAVGYSYDALASAPNALEVSAAVNDPAFKVAGDRIDAYKAQVCGIPPS